jgi:hypothetical protein
MNLIIQQRNFSREKNIIAVDSNFLEFFGFKMLEGDPATVLLKPGSVVVTADIAKKYFGNEKGYWQNNSNERK